MENETKAVENKNLEIWNKLKHPPEDQLTTIQGGRLKGMTDIKPQWRYQIMTETFGICGIGWKFEIIRQEIVDGSDGQKIAFVDIMLFIKVEDKWSDPIPSNGGSMLIAKESKGLYTSDEAFKMATTDALSTAMKMIGVAADIYMGEFSGGKYKNKSEEPNGGKNDFGTPTHPFSRDNIIEFGMHSKTGDGANKKWIELPDKYLETLNKKVTGGYKKFVEKEIAFRANDKKLKDEREEDEEEKTLTKEEAKKVNEEGRLKKEKEKIDKANKLKKMAEKAQNEVEKEVEESTTEKPTPDENEIGEDLRRETVARVNEMKRMGHMKETSAESWIKKAGIINDPIIFHRFYWAVTTAEIVCKASDSNKINKETKVNYFKTIKDPKSKISDFEPIIADLNKLMEKK